MSKFFVQTAQPLIDQLDEPLLRQALSGAYHEAALELEIIEEAFSRFAEARHPLSVRRTFMHSWHATHLKMLPIYGLTSRIHNLADASEGHQLDYYEAAALNASTSHEDLNLGLTEPFTHSQLFERLADAICEGDDWKLSRYLVPEAAEFKAWLYRQMVAEDIPTGLLTNLFSEIYNHCEYTLATQPFRRLLGEQMGLEPVERDSLLVYVTAHVESDVEVGHFLVMVESLKRFYRAEQRPVSFEGARELFATYLSHIAQIMAALIDAMTESLADPNHVEATSLAV